MVEANYFHRFRNLAAHFPAFLLLLCIICKQHILSFVSLYCYGFHFAHQHIHIAAIHLKTIKGAAAIPSCNGIHRSCKVAGIICRLHFNSSSLLAASHSLKIAPASPVSLQRLNKITTSKRVARYNTIELQC